LELLLVVCGILGAGAAVGIFEELLLLLDLARVGVLGLRWLEARGSLGIGLDLVDFLLEALEVFDFFEIEDEPYAVEGILGGTPATDVACSIAIVDCFLIGALLSVGGTCTDLTEGTFLVTGELCTGTVVSESEAWGTLTSVALDSRCCSGTDTTSCDLFFGCFFGNLCFKGAFASSLCN
jgi:hypothetical protein